MKHAAIFIFALISVGAALGKDARPDDAAVQELVVKVKAALPSGWSVTYSSVDTVVTGSRTKPEMISAVGENGYVGADGTIYPPPTLRQYDFKFRVTPLIDNNEYKRWEEENKPIKKKTDEIRSELLHIPTIHGMGDSLWSVTQDKAQREADDRKIQNYARILDTLHKLPTYHVGRVSLFYDFMDLVPVDRVVMLECRKVESNVCGLFSSY